MSKLVRIIGAACCLIMVASFVVFAYEQNSAATERQVSVISGADPGFADQQQSQAVPMHSDVRQKIDDANEVLAKPFAWITKNVSSQWVKHGVTLLCGLLLYGLFLFWLARLIPKGRPKEPSVWQA